MVSAAPTPGARRVLDDADVRTLEDEMRREFPRLRFVAKDGDAFSRLVDVALRIATLGGQRFYMTRYVTTIGATIWLPSGWERRSALDRIATLRHERVHLRQFRRFGLVGMSVLYLLPILPIGLAYGRARLEWEAYAETIRAHAELAGPAAARSPELRAHVLRQFVSSAYGWMWPFPRTVNRWIDALLDEIAP
ncbi:MAG: hypothetical protein IT379_16465 [Deltaproteobacteria bacterium]|nr:hypothetical protein [Deltaproteobacteria bacterium]